MAEPGRRRSPATARACCRKATTARRLGPLGAGLSGLLLATGFGGCIEFGHGETKTADDVTDAKPEVVRAPASDRAAVELKGTMLTITATARCDLVEMETVTQTTKTEREFEDDLELPIGMLTVLSLVPIGAGIGLLADSPNVYQDDPNQRLYNATGQDAVVTTGAVLIVLGAAIAAWPTVELIRWGVPETETTTSTRQGNVLQRSVPCRADQTAGGHNVSLRYSGGTFSVGTTDASGTLMVDLKQSLPVTPFQAPVPPVSMGVWLDSQLIGEIGVASIGMALLGEREQQDDLAWRAAEPGACANGPSETACAGVRRYLGSFPQGRHAADATTLLARLGTALTPPGGQVTMAVGPPSALLQRAVSEAQAAAQTAMDTARAKVDLAAQKAEEAAVKQIAAAGHDACLKTCRQVCAADRSCRKSCEEQCP
jgi:hypothetical protein